MEWDGCPHPQAQALDHLLWVTLQDHPVEQSGADPTGIPQSRLCSSGLHHPVPQFPSLCKAPGLEEELQCWWQKGVPSSPLAPSQHPGDPLSLHPPQQELTPCPRSHPPPGTSPPC